MLGSWWLLFKSKGHAVLHTLSYLAMTDEMPERGCRWLRLVYGLSGSSQPALNDQL